MIERVPKTGAWDLHFYVGPSWTSRPYGGFDASQSIGYSEVNSGWNLAISGAKGVYAQTGIEPKTGNKWAEFPGATSAFPGTICLSAFYVFPAIELRPPKYENLDPVSYFQNEVDDLTKAVMIGQMQQDTGQLISENPAVGILFYANYLLTVRMLGM